MSNSGEMPSCLLGPFFTSLNLSKPIFIDLFLFFEPQSPPKTSKINEKPLVFIGFLLFSHFAQDARKSSKDTPKMLPGSPKTPQNPSKTLPRRLKMAPRYLQDAPKTLQDAPKTHSRHARHALRLPKTPPNPQTCLPTPPKLDL